MATKRLISDEVVSDVTHWIIDRRLSEKDILIKDCIRLFEKKLSYSVVYDVIQKDIIVARSKVLGMYYLALHLGVIPQDEYLTIVDQLYVFLEPEIIIESAINKMKGNK